MTVTLVTPYNPSWPGWFAKVRSRVEPALAGVPHRIEHVGSTSIYGMTAKPIIDLDIVVERADFAAARERLVSVGYAHQGDKGIPDREAFDLTDTEARRSLPAHHLYVCMAGTAEVARHMAFRDFLRKHPEWVEKLSRHKIQLCEQYANDRQAYMDGKSDMVRQITELAAEEARIHE